MAATLNQLRLGYLLSQLRTAAGMTVQEAAETSGILKRMSLARVEKGQAPCSWPDAKELAKYYGASPRQVARVVELAKDLDGSGDWEDSQIDPDFKLYLSMEPQASELLIFDPEVITGIFQTVSYASAVLTAMPGFRPGDIPASADLKERRRAGLLTSRGPRITYIATEGAITRQVGGERVHKEQLNTLCDLVSDRVSIRVLPSNTGAYPGMTGAYTLMRYTSPEDRDTVYTEHVDGCRYIRSFSIVDRFAAMFEGSKDLSVSIKEFVCVA